MSANLTLKVVEDLNGDMFGDQARVGVAVTGTFPTNGVLETFTGADGTTPPNSNWSNTIQNGTGNLGIDTNRGTVLTGDPGGGWWNTTSFTANQEAYTTISSIAGGDYLQVFGRVVNPGLTTMTGYYCQARRTTSELRVYRWDTGITLVQLGSAVSQTVSDGDAIGMTLNGTTITLYYKVGAGAWTSMGTFDGSAYNNGGFIGVQMSNTTYVDGFGGGNI